MNYEEGQQLLSQVTGAPMGGPEKPSWFSSRSSNEWTQYDNYNEMQTQMQRAILMNALDQKFHPLSLGEASRVTGMPMEQMANPDQMGPTGTDIRYEPSVIEGPRPMGTRPGFGPVIGQSRGEPGEYVTNPDELFPRGLSETPNLMSGMYQDFLEKKPPYYEEGQLINHHATIDEPVELQGPGAPVEGPMKMIETPTGSGPRADAPSDWVQRALTEAAIHRNSLRPPNAAHESAEERKLRMARDYYTDPEKFKAEGVVSGAINTDRQVRGTESQANVNAAKADSLKAQADATRALLGTRVANLKERTRMLSQQLHEAKDTEGIRKEKITEQVALSKVLQRYYDARLANKEADVAMREANFQKGLNELQLKELKAQLAYIKEIKPDVSSEDWDQIISGLGKKFGIDNIEREKSSLEKVGDYLFGPDESDVEVGDVPHTQTPAMQESHTRSMRSKQKSQSLVPNPPPPSAPQAPDAGKLMQEVEKSLGDVSKLEGKTIRNKKDGKSYKIVNGKPVLVQ